MLRRRDALRVNGLPYMLEHADHLRRLLDRHSSDAMVRLSLTDDGYRHSSTLARWQLEISLPADG